MCLNIQGSYLSANKYNYSDIPTFALTAALMRCFYHLGSLALGALIIAIIQIFRAILNYIDRKTKRQQNSCIKCLVCFCKCCLWCLEKCLRYISKNAYILTAIYGYGFCKASCKAVKALLKIRHKKELKDNNPTRVSI